MGVKYIIPKGRLRKRYRDEDVTTPYEKLKALPNATDFLKPGVTFKQLDDDAYAISDLIAAQNLNQARDRLFQSIHRAQTA